MEDFAVFIGAGSVGCLGYGLSFYVFVVAILIAFFSFKRKFKQKAAVTGANPKPGKIPLSREDRPFVYKFLTLVGFGFAMWSTAAYFESHGMRAGWFDEQTECPSLWPTPRSLGDVDL